MDISAVQETWRDGSGVETSALTRNIRSGSPAAAGEVAKRVKAQKDDVQADLDAALPASTYQQHFVLLHLLPPQPPGWKTFSYSNPGQLEFWEKNLRKFYSCCISNCFQYRISRYRTRWNFKCKC